MAPLFVESEPGTALASVERALAPFGARLARPYPNLRLLLHTQLALFEVPTGTPLAPMAAVPGSYTLRLPHRQSSTTG